MRAADFWIYLGLSGTADLGGSDRHVFFNKGRQICADSESDASRVRVDVITAGHLTPVAKNIKGNNRGGPPSDSVDADSPTLSLILRPAQVTWNHFPRLHGTISRSRPPGNSLAPTTTRRGSGLSTIDYGTKPPVAFRSGEPFGRGSPAIPRPRSPCGARGSLRALVVL